MQEYEKTNATLTLLSELAKGKKSGEEEGWLSPDDMKTHFIAKVNEE